MFKKLDLYMLKLFFITLFVVIITIGLTFVVLNMVERLRYFLDNDMSLLQIAEYYIYFAGWVLKSFFPVFVLLATLFTLSFLARKNEILAMKSAGISLYRIALPFLIVTVLLSAGHFYYNEYIYPPANKKRVEIKEFTLKNRSKRRFEKVTNIYRQISPGYFYTLSMFNVPRKEGNDIKIYKTEGNSLKALTTASNISYENFQWIARNGTIRIFDDSLGESFTTFDTMTLTDIKDKPEDLAKRIGKPEDMGLEELQKYVRLMKRSGGPYAREAIDIKIKYSFPMASVIVVMICIPFAANPRKGGVAVSFAVGILISLVYFVTFRILQSAGYSEKIPDYVAVWGVNGVFFIIGLISLIKAKK